MSDSYVHVCFAVRPNCYNMEASCYGICHGCGCCAKDKRVRYESRVRYLQGELEEKEHFKYWDDDPKMRAIQEENIKSDIKWFKRRIRYYEKRLKEVTGE